MCMGTSYESYYTLAAGGNASDETKVSGKQTPSGDLSARVSTAAVQAVGGSCGHADEVKS